MPAALLGLFINFVQTAWLTSAWFYVVPSLIVLTAAILFYVLAAVLHHQRHPALSPMVEGLVAEVERPLFHWPIGLLIPVWLAVCLLVPEDANQVHLDLLSGLARKFSDQDFVDQIKSATNKGDLYRLFRQI